MHSYRVTALSVLGALIVAGCAAHGSAVPPIALRGVTKPLVYQTGTSAWQTLTIPQGVYADNLVAGFDDAMWYCQIISNSQSAVSRIDMSGNVTTFPLMLEQSDSSCNSLTSNPDGRLYFEQVAQNGSVEMGSISMSGKVAYLNLSAPIEQGQMVSGSDGNLWIVTFATAHVYCVTTTGKVTEYQNPGELDIQDVIEGPDGNVWFGQNYQNHRDYALTGKITPTGVITLYPSIPHGNGLAAGADGGIWYFSTKAMERVDPATGLVTTYPTTFENPGGSLSPGPGDALYFVQPALKGDFHLQAFNVKTHQATLYSAIPGTDIEGISSTAVMGPDKNVWLANPNDDAALVVYLWREISTVPASVAVTVGQSAPMSASEKRVPDAILSAVSNDQTIATVSGGDGSFMIYGAKSGTTTITVSDNLGNSLSVPVTVN